MEQLKVLKDRLNHIQEDLMSVKRIMIQFRMEDTKKTEHAWNDLLSASTEISKKWKGRSAVEEIRKQREKN